MMQGLMGGIADKFRGDEGSARLYGIGLLASQLAAGQTPDASPALAMLDQRKAQKAFKNSMADPGMMEKFGEQERAFLSTLPPSAAQSLIAQRVFAGPADPFAGTQVINGQLVGMGENGPQVLGDFNTPDPGYVQLSPEEAAARGLDAAKGWQISGDGKISEIGGAGVNVTVGGGPELGKLSTDFDYERDEEGRPIRGEDGQLKAAPVPGSPAWQEREDAKSAAVKAAQTASDYAKTVTQDVSSAFNYLDDIGKIAAGDGIMGANLRKSRANIAGTPEYNMKGYVESALSNLTLDTMNRMRESSPSGATGMGNMSDAQLRVIQGVLGQWDPALPIDDQRYILGRLGNFYLDVQVGTRREREEAVANGLMTPEQNAEIEQMYWPDQRDAVGRPEAPATQPDNDGWTTINGVRIREIR